MTTVEAGPYELIKQTPYSKVTFCLMDDNSISMREYNRDNNVTTRSNTQLVDITAALGYLETELKEYKNKKYEEIPAPVTALPKVLGKRPKQSDKEETKERKRDVKEEIKKGVRKSARVIGMPKPIYDEAEI